MWKCGNVQMWKPACRHVPKRIDKTQILTIVMI